MAIPPEPLDEVLPDARWVVEAEVVEVLESEPTHAPATPPGFTGAGKTGRQVVRLAVKRVLRGEDVPDEITAIKPEAGYSLRSGNKGPFLLGGTAPRAIILGRYGPDTFRIEDVVKALSR